MTTAALAELLDHMARHHGVASRSTVRASGIDARSEHRAVRAGILRVVAPGVLAAAGAPPTWQQAAVVATAGPGRPVLVHGSAARAHSLAGFRDHPTMEVLATAGRHVPVGSGVTVHQTRGPVTGSLTAHVTWIDGVPTVDLGTCLALLGAVESAERTAIAVRDAMHAAMSDEMRDARRDDSALPALRAAVAAWRTRGRRGPERLATLLDELDGRPLPDRWWWRLADRAGRHHGLRLRPVAGHPGVPPACTLVDVEHRLGVRVGRTWWTQHDDEGDDIHVERWCPGDDTWSVVEVGWRHHDRIPTLAATIAAIATTGGRPTRSG